MKAHIQIPKGWRRVRTGARVHKSDRFFLNDTKRWRKMSRITEYPLVCEGELVIRRVARKGK